MHLNKKSHMSELWTLGSDPEPCSYINTLAWGGGGGRKLGAPTLLNSFLWPTMHFISWASVTHTPTARHIKAIIGIGAAQAVLHNDTSTVSLHPNYYTSKTAYLIMLKPQYDEVMVDN